MAEPIILDLDDELERCYTCREDLSNQTEPPGITITIQESTNATKTLSICSLCVNLLDFEHPVSPVRTLTGCPVLPESKVIIKANETPSFCLRCLSCLQNDRDIPVSIREGIFDQSCPSLPENAVFDFAVHLCNKCLRFKKRSNRMTQVISLGYPTFHVATHVMDIPPPSQAPTNRGDVTYPVSMLVNKSKAIIKYYKEDASMSSPPANIKSNSLYLHSHKDDQPSSLHWSCDGFQLKKCTTRSVRIANCEPEHVIKEIIWSTSGNPNIKTDFRRRVITSTHLDGITIVHYLGEIMESKKVSREVEVLDDDEESSEVISSTGRLSANLSRSASITSSTSGRTTPPLPGLRSYSPADLLSNLATSLLSSDNESCGDAIDQTCPEIADTSYFTMPSRHAALTTNTGGVLRLQFKLMPLAVFNKVWTGTEWSSVPDSEIHPSVAAEVKRLVEDVHMNPAAVTEAFSGLKLDDLFTILDMTSRSAQIALIQQQDGHEWRSFSGPWENDSTSVKYTLVPVNVNIHREIAQYLEKSVPEMKKVPVVGSTGAEQQQVSSISSKLDTVQHFSGTTKVKKLPARNKNSTLKNILNGLQRSQGEEDSDPDDPDDNPDEPNLDHLDPSDPDYIPAEEDYDLVMEEPPDPLEVPATMAPKRKKYNSGNLPTISRVTGNVGGFMKVSQSGLLPTISNTTASYASTRLPTITNVVSANSSADLLPTISNVVGNFSSDLPAISNVVGNATMNTATPDSTVTHVLLGGVKVPVVFDSSGNGVIHRPDGTKLLLKKPQGEKPLVRLQQNQKGKHTNLTQRVQVSRAGSQPQMIHPRPNILPVQTPQIVASRSSNGIYHSLAPGSSSMQTISMLPQTVMSQAAIGRNIQGSKTVLVRNKYGEIERVALGNLHLNSGNSFLPKATSPANLVASLNQNQLPESHLNRLRVQSSGVNSGQVVVGSGGNSGQIIMVPPGSQLLQVPGAAGEKRLVMINRTELAQKSQPLQPLSISAQSNIKLEPSDPLAPQLSPIAATTETQVQNQTSYITPHTKLSREISTQSEMLSDIAEYSIFDKTYSDILIYGSDSNRMPVQTHSLVLASISNNMKTVLKHAERNAEGKFELIVPSLDLNDLDIFLDEVIGALMKKPGDGQDASEKFNIKPSLWGLLAGFSGQKTEESRGRIWYKGPDTVIVNNSIITPRPKSKIVNSSEEPDEEALKRKRTESEEEKDDVKPPKGIKLASFCKLSDENPDNIAVNKTELEKSLRESLFEDSVDSNDLEGGGDDSNDIEEDGGDDAEMIEDTYETPVMVAPVFEESEEVNDKYEMFTNKSYNINEDNLPIIPVKINVLRRPLNPDEQIQCLRQISLQSSIKESAVCTLQDLRDNNDLKESTSEQIEMNEVSDEIEPAGLNDITDYSDDVDDLKNLRGDVTSEMVTQNRNNPTVDLDLELEKLDKMLDEFNDIPAHEVIPKKL